VPSTLDYPLQNTPLDITTTEAYALSPGARLDYCLAVIRGFAKVTTKNEFFLKHRIPVARELKELRAMVALAPDAHLRLDEGTFQRDVLGRPTPTHGTHTEHASRAMARMRTKFGSVTNEVTKAAAWSHAHPDLARLEYDRMPRSSVPPLVKRLDALLDISNISKDAYREGHEQILSTICRHLVSHFNLRTAFPPFHARFLVSRYAPARGRVVVLDPCAGWGGRLLGTLTIPRRAAVRYIGCDPNTQMTDAYQTLTSRVTEDLRFEKSIGRRTAKIYPVPFEDWLKTAVFRRMRAKVHVAITSPPYWSTEEYAEEDAENRTQSCHRYAEYAVWRERFLRRMVFGVAQCLVPNGVFILNVANVKGRAPRLEEDAALICREAGLVEESTFKLAMAVAVGTQHLGVTDGHQVFIDGRRYRYEPVVVWRKTPKSAAKRT
jgi:hypothetical protein